MASTSSDHQVTTLIGTAITLGIVHVLTGPDHLSAIATLSANVEHSAFWLGIRWGIGHSTGLVLVGIVFIVLSLSSSSSDDDAVIQIPDKVSHIFESLVGIFMLVLGIYGVRRAWAKRPKRYFFEQGGFQDPLSDPIQSTQEEEMQNMVSYQEQSGRDSSDVNENNNHQNSSANNSSNNHSHNHIDGFSDEYRDEDRGNSNDTDGCREQSQECCSCLDRLLRRVPTRAMALGAGIVHGLAGPGGVLGVIPAVQLHDARLASIYLFFFCFTSTLTMGLFASLYGSCSSRLAGRPSAAAGEEQQSGSSDNNIVVETTSTRTTAETASYRAFWIECLSASLSILVGIVWLALLSVGKLEDVFP